jgi:signal peptidase I
VIVSRFVGRKVFVNLGLFSLLAAGTFVQPYRLVIVEGKSMAPTYADKSTHLAMRADGPLYRGEVVVLNSPVGTVVKRIVFLPGDQFVQIKMGDTWAYAGTKYVKHTNAPHVRVRTYTVLPGEVFVRGDNRLNSVDSTSFGPVPASNILDVLVDQEPLHFNKAFGTNILT